MESRSWWVIMSQACGFLGKGQSLPQVSLSIVFFFFNSNVWLPLTHPVLGNWPATHACALTGSRTGNPLVHRPAQYWASPARAVYCLFESRLTYLWNVRVISFFHTSQDTTWTPEHETTDHSLFSCCPHTSLCAVHVNYTTASNEKELCVFLFGFFSHPRDFPTLLPPTLHLPPMDFM